MKTFARSCAFTYLLLLISGIAAWTKMPSAGTMPTLGPLVVSLLVAGFIAAIATLIKTEF